MDSKVTIIKELFHKIVSNNKMLQEVTSMDESTLHNLADIIADMLALPPNVDDGKEYGEFFLLKWPAPDGSARSAIPELEQRFLSRTAALDMAKALNQGTVVAHGKVPYYDVATLSWATEYINMASQLEDDLQEINEKDLEPDKKQNDVVSATKSQKNRGKKGSN